MSNQWIVLRCANAQTLKLADTLSASGIQAWSPREAVLAKGKQTTAAMMPSFVFADARCVADLFAISNSFNSPHPGFWIFRPFGTVALISEMQLSPLRLIERRRKPRGIVKAVAVGTRVRLSEGGFAGLPGEVKAVRGKYASIAFEGFPMTIDVPLWVVQEELDEYQADNVCRPRAANAA